jgi:hypothetical protein
MMCLLIYYWNITPYMHLPLAFSMSRIPIWQKAGAKAKQVVKMCLIAPPNYKQGNAT